MTAPAVHHPMARDMPLLVFHRGRPAAHALCPRLTRVARGRHRTTHPMKGNPAMNRHATRTAPESPGMTLTPQAFAAIVGGLLTLIAIIMLALPVSVSGSDTTYGCGTAFTGLDRSDIQAEDYRNAGREIGAAQYGTIPAGLVDTTDLLERCEDRITTQRLIGYPLGGIGLIVLAGAAMIRPAGKSGTHVTGEEGSS